MKKKKPRRQTGAMRMMELKYRPVQVWFSQNEYNQVEAAAKKDGRKVAPFVHVAALKWAEYFGDWSGENKK